MRTPIALALAFVCALSLTACSGAASDEKDASAQTDSSQPATQIANPITEYDLLADAVDAAGFAFDVPESIGAYNACAYLVIAAGTGDALIEVDYAQDAAASSDDEYVVRKAAGADDVSGDYNSYAEESTLDADGISYALKGNDGQVNLVTWERGGYAYSLAAYGAAALSADEVEGIVLQIQ